MQVMDYAIDNGYTFVWGADVSEKGFATKDAGGCRDSGNGHEGDERCGNC